MVKLPGRCNICGKDYAQCRFKGDYDCALVAEEKCKECGGLIYRNDQEDYESEPDIGRSARYHDDD